MSELERQMSELSKVSEQFNKLASTLSRKISELQNAFRNLPGKVAVKVGGGNKAAAFLRRDGKWVIAVAAVNDPCIEDPGDWDSVEDVSVIRKLEFVNEFASKLATAIMNGFRDLQQPISDAIGILDDVIGQVGGGAGPAR